VQAKRNSRPISKDHSRGRSHSFAVMNKTVLIAKEEVRKSDAAEILMCGTIVRRGPHWDKMYKEQNLNDNREEMLGEVLADTGPNNWAPVKWKTTGKVHFYRWGIRSCLSRPEPKFDIEIVELKSDTNFSTSKLEQLLASIIYPHWVGFCIYVSRVGNICTVSQSFQVDLNLTLTWKADPYENWHWHQNNHNPHWEPRWQPQIYFPNAKEVLMNQHILNCDSQEYRTEYIGNLLWITVRLELKLRLTELFEMQSFPFDCQDLTLRIQCRDPIDRVRLVPLPQIRKDYLPELKNDRKQFMRVRRDTFTDQEWRFSNAMLEIVETRAEDDDFGAKFSAIAVRFKIERLWMLYFLRVVVILFFIVTGSTTSFSVDPLSDGGERLNLCCVFILTTVTFLLVVSEYIPKIPYLTILDKYCFSVLLFVILVLLESAVITRTETPETNDIPSDSVYMGTFNGTWLIASMNELVDTKRSETDFLFKYVYLIILVLMHIYFVVLSYRAWHRERIKITSSSSELETLGVEKNINDLQIALKRSERKDLNLGISKNVSSSFDTHQSIYQAETKVNAGWFHGAQSVKQVEIPPLSQKFFKQFESQVVILGRCHTGAYSMSRNLTDIISRNKTFFVKESKYSEDGSELPRTSSQRSSTQAEIQELKSFFRAQNIPYSMCNTNSTMPESPHYTVKDAAIASGVSEFPQVYIKGRFKGGIEEIMKLEREGKLNDFKISSPPMLEKENGSPSYPNIMEKSASILSCRDKSDVT